MYIDLALKREHVVTFKCDKEQDTLVMSFYVDSFLIRLKTKINRVS